MKLNIFKTKNLKHSFNVMFEQIKKTSGQICVLVPDKLSVSCEKMLFEYLQIESSFDIDILTLTRFSQKILTELDVDYNAISKLGGVILLKKILNENASKLRLFNSGNFSYQYSNLLYETLTQFKSSKVSINDLYVPQKSKHLDDKLHDLQLILAEYENQKAGFIDSPDRLDLTSININKSEYVKNTTFFILGFTDWTTQGYTLIEQLVTQSLAVNLSVYDTNKKNKYLYTDEISRHFIDFSIKSQLPYFIYDNDFESNNLHNYLSNNLLSLENSAYVTDKIQLYNGKSIDEEIEFVARNIRQKILDGNHFYQYGVACHELESFKNKLISAFEKYGINYYIDTSTPLNQTMYYKFFVNYINLFTDNFQLVNIIELINSPFLNIPYEYRLKINTLLSDINFSGNLSYLNVEENLKIYIDKLNYITTTFAIKSNETIDSLISIFHNLSAYLNIDETITMYESCIDSTQVKKIISQMADSFDNLLESIKEFYPNATTHEILDILENASQEQKILPIPQSLDCVQIIDANEILTNFETLYVINTNSKTAPKIVQDVGVILDKDIDSISFKYKLSPTIAHINKISKFKLLNNFQMFNNELIITMSCQNNNEKSIVVKDLESRIFTGNPSDVENKLKVINIHDTIKNYKILSKSDLVEFLSRNFETSKQIMSTYNIQTYDLQEYLNDDNIKNINFKEISCSALENYFKCPTRFFFTNLIKLKQEKEQGIAKNDIGNMIHKLAEDYYKNKNKDNLVVEDFCSSMLFKYMKEDRKLTSYINTPIHINLIKEAIRFINHLRVLDENSQFAFAFAEYSFGLNQGRTIPITDEVFLRGKIDRIDFCNNYVRIIDYKTGNVDSSLEELYYGQKLQLFLYSKFASEYFKKDIAGSFYMPIKNSIQSSVSAIAPYKLVGYYVANNDLAPLFDKNIYVNRKSNLMSLSLDKENNISISEKSTTCLYPSDYNQLTDYALQVSQNAIKEIKSGYIIPTPIRFNDRSDSCNYCPYLALCRKNSYKVAFRDTCNVNISTFRGDNNE